MKENQRVALTKRLLKEGMVRCLRRKPLEKVCVSELCEESGINRATFYRHYDTPQDVLRDLARDLIRGLDIPSIQIQTLEEAEKVLEKTYTYLYEQAELVRLLIHNHTDEDITRSLNLLCERLWNTRSTFKSLDLFDKEELDLFITCLGGGSYFLLRRWLLEENPRSPREIAELSINFLRKLIIGSN